MIKENPDYLLERILKNLDDVSEILEKFRSEYNNEVKKIREDLITVKQEVISLRNRTCPRSPEILKEIIEVERLRHQAKQPKKIMEIIGWVVTITGGLIALYYAITHGGK